ncbi:MAG: GNAT family N-acetyltransferase [Tuberibacillus sp.]
MNQIAFPNLETERLFLKILTLDDAEALYRHFSDPEVTRFMDIETCKSTEEARGLIQEHLDDEGCRWGLFDKESQQLIGTAGFHCIRKTDDGFMAEFGYDLAQAFWGKGLMPEALLAVLDFGFTQMKLDIIDATVEPENDRSIKLLNKLGFTKHEELKDQLLYYDLKRQAHPARR